MNPAWINVIISVFLFGAFGVNLVLSVRFWWRDRAARSLRMTYIALLLEVGMISFILGSLGRIYPELVEFSRFVGAIVLGMLLVGAIVVNVTWAMPDVIRPEGPRKP